MVFATLAFLGAFGADQGLLTYFADLSGPGLPYALDRSKVAHGQQGYGLYGWEQAMSTG